MCCYSDISSLWACGKYCFFNRLWLPEVGSIPEFSLISDLIPGIGLGIGIEKKGIGIELELTKNARN